MIPIINFLEKSWLRQSDASLLVYVPRKCPPLLSLNYQPIVDYSDRLTSDSKHDLLNKRVHS